MAPGIRKKDFGKNKRKRDFKQKGTERIDEKRVPPHLRRKEELKKGKMKRLRRT